MIKMIAILDVIQPCSCSYTVHYALWSTAVGHILTHSAKLAFGPQKNTRLGSGSSMWSWARFGLYNEARLELCDGQPTPRRQSRRHGGTLMG